MELMQLNYYQASLKQLDDIADPTYCLGDHRGDEDEYSQDDKCDLDDSDHKVSEAQHAKAKAEIAKKVQGHYENKAFNTLWKKVEAHSEETMSWKHVELVDYKVHRLSAGWSFGGGKMLSVEPNTGLKTTEGATKMLKTVEKEEKNNKGKDEGEEMRQKKVWTRNWVRRRMQMREPR